jgi:hypothetical protein
LATHQWTDWLPLVHHEYLSPPATSTIYISIISPSHSSSIRLSEELLMAHMIIVTPLLMKSSQIFPIHTDCPTILILL